MSSSDRQSRLLLNQDWKRIYQSFRNADFQSYDFDNLRRTMINYLRQNYPEDFNDYIESSEYLALIDLIAFLGQNLSFRIDLNARENFLETAERRESILRLAKMLSYNPRRNMPANGLLKIDSIKTSEEINDSTGFNLSNITVKWNDPTNSNYFEQFVKILNAALPTSSSIGRPVKSAIVGGVATEQYRFNSNISGTPVFGFSKSVEGISTRFEVVSADIQNSNIIEEAPFPGASPAFLYRDDGQGANSTNTGFFMHFRQGTLESGNFRVTSPVPNQVISVDATNINNSDVWLYSVDSNGFETDLWNKLDSTFGNNVIYNSLFNNIRNIYSVSTRIDDRINLIFSDGVFGNLPAGNFRVYYRISANRSMVISPGDLRVVNIEIPYISKNNTAEQITLSLSLKNTITNSNPSESNDSIKQNAPATYYTQNRLITAEDYNVGPLSVSQDIVKTKSVNRISSGISRYFDLKDVTGRYSNTSLFANDGIVYREDSLNKRIFTFNTQTDIENVIINTVEPILSSTEVKNFYMLNFSKINTADLNINWKTAESYTNYTSGVFENITKEIQSVGTFTSGVLRYIETGAMCKFRAPEGYAYDRSNNLVIAPTTLTYGVKTEIWTAVVSVANGGTNFIENVAGSIVFTDFVPTDSLLVQILPKFSTSILEDVKIDIIDRIFDYRNFALRYEVETRQWRIIFEENINTNEDFSLGKTGDNTAQFLDSSWLLYFKTNGESYTITYRGSKFVFESESEIKFLFSGLEKVYNPETGKVVKDKIQVLNINRQLNSPQSYTQDFEWSIVDSYKNSDGYTDMRRVYVKFYDDDNDGIIDDPDMFTKLVPTVNYVFQKRTTTQSGTEIFKYLNNDKNQIQIYKNELLLRQSGRTGSGSNDGQVFYLEDEKIFKINNRSQGTLDATNEYRAYVGRDQLKFHYMHVADSNYRIDPSVSNIIDTYILTKNYDTEYKKYLNGTLPTIPLPPSTDELFRNYSQKINAIKSISDEVIYHPVKYKALFGNKADPNLQVTFKVVKNNDFFINVNELKADIIGSIDQFFSIENWDFGETFYFQELSTHIMNQLSPRIASIVIVPKQANLSFGSLFEVSCNPDEIFASAAQVSDIEIIDQITETKLQAAGTIITKVDTANTGIQSSNLNR
jgi:hypothetical protein